MSAWNWITLINCGTILLSLFTILVNARSALRPLDCAKCGHACFRHEYPKFIAFWNLGGQCDKCPCPKLYRKIPKRDLVIKLLSERPMRGLELVKASGGQLRRGSIYILLDMMEDEGLISSQYVQDEKDREWKHLTYFKEAVE